MTQVHLKVYNIKHFLHTMLAQHLLNGVGDSLVLVNVK